MFQGRWTGVKTLMVLLGAAFFTQTGFAKTFPAVPGQYVVKLKAQTSSVKIQSLTHLLNAQIVRRISRDSGAYLIQRPVTENSQYALSQLNQSGIVEYAEPNYIYTINGGQDALPNDPELANLWGMVNTGQDTNGDFGEIQGRAGIDIDAARAWKVETGSHDIKIAVIDTGVDYNLPDLAPNIWTNQVELNGKAGIDDDNNGCVDDIHGCDFVNKDGDPMDDHGHGSHVSGTIAGAGDNGTGIVGVAWHAQIVGVKFLSAQGGGTLADAVSAIDYARMVGVKIMSNSWGGGGFSQALMDAITRAKDAGILFVAAAGNDGHNNDSTPTYPASYDVDNVVSVAAIDAAGQLASFSNYGHSVSIAAPGVNIISNTPNGLQSWSGTSMATPHVSGVAALLYSQDSSQTYAQVKQRLLAGARPLAGLRNKVASGLVDAYYSLTNQKAPNDPNDPFYWQKTAQTISTPHPYPVDFQQQWTLSVPGAKHIAVHFTTFDTEAGYDVVTFTDATGKVLGKMSGSKGDSYSQVFDTDTVIMSFASDHSVSRQGFDVDGIAYQ